MYPSDDQIIFGVFIKNIERTLKNAGFNVVLHVIRGRGVTIWGKIIKYAKFYTKSLFTDLSSFDVVHISYPSHSFLPFFLKRKKGAKFIVRLHGHDLVAAHKETLLFRLLRFISLQACRRADGIIVPSRFFLCELQKLAPKIAVSVAVIPSGGIDTTVFKPIPQLEADHGKICFGYVGRIDQGKGVDLFVRALATLPHSCSAIIVGGGPYLSKLEEMIRELGLVDRCNIVGPVPYSELPDYYNQIDLLVFPTLFKESFGNVVLEAMACGVPVLASNHGAPADFITTGVDGLKATPGDVDSLQQKMKEFLDLTTEERKLMQKNAIEKAGHYSAPIIDEQYCSYISHVSAQI
ncbi:MAG TPA: glycosyltransferase family 4 protein [Pedomonas sp.]|uniref:glycosyltransferase family 4 protein n=1 Tax=Pedomonas sp. TaxID=2976421 RepID=UPI002F4296DF